MPPTQLPRRTAPSPVNAGVLKSEGQPSPTGDLQLEPPFPVEPVALPPCRSATWQRRSGRGPSAYPAREIAPARGPAPYELRVNGWSSRPRGVALILNSPFRSYGRFPAAFCMRSSPSKSLLTRAEFAFTPRMPDSICRRAYHTVGPIGSARRRLPVAAKMALQSAGANGGTPGSPTPLGGTSMPCSTMCVRVSSATCRCARAGSR